MVKNSTLPRASHATKHLWGSKNISFFSSHSWLHKKSYLLVFKLVKMRLPLSAQLARMSPMMLKWFTCDMWFLI